VLRTKKYTLYAPAASSSSGAEDSATEGDMSAENKTVPSNMSTRSKKKYEAALRHSARGANKPVRAQDKQPTTLTALDVDPVNTTAVGGAGDVEPSTDSVDVQEPSAVSVVPVASAPVERVPLYTFRFGAVLVDPPRCGLDKLTLSLVSGYNHILYISCSPESLMRDLKAVSVSTDFMFC